jgi:hypothetical protein
VVSFSARLIAGKSRQQTNHYSRRLSAADDVHQLSEAVQFDQDIMPDERAFNMQHTVQAVNSLHLHTPTTAGGCMKSTRPEGLYPRLPPATPVTPRCAGLSLHAAARAIESLRADALFFDPFAQLLAGPKAMARHQNVAEADKSVDLSTPAAPAAPADSTAPAQQQQQLQHQLQQQIAVPQYEGRQVSRIVLRTVFFDEATLLVTGQPAPRSGKVLEAVAQHIQQQQLVPCSQVRWSLGYLSVRKARGYGWRWGHGRQ